MPTPSIGANWGVSEESYPGAQARARLLVCDDQKLIRTRVRQMLKGVASIEIVGEAADGPSAVLMACQLRPDLVLMDLSMPGLDGSEATRQLLARCPEIRVLAFSADSTTASMRKMFNAGARGYLIKTGDPAELVAALELVHAGGCFISAPTNPSAVAPRHD
jgi:DNA-binding NarL/FixJ family response regulator